MRYAVLFHTGGTEHDHYDFMVEEEEGKGDLATWRLPIWPIQKPEDAVRLRDHRRIYLTYQGQVSGNRGDVVRIDEGNVQVECMGGFWRLTFAGGRIIELYPEQDEKWIARPMDT